MTKSEVELVDIIYHYSREQAIESMGENTCLDVLRACEELSKLRQEKGEDYPPDAFRCKFSKINAINDRQRNQQSHK